VEVVRQQAAAERDRYREKFPALIAFDYRYTDQPEFNVAAIYRDDRFTYIRANPQETPALYEIRDGKPGLIHFRYSDGLYTADKVLDRGYLAIGKKRLHFTREERR
jgi:type IV secretion system protein VirB9